MTRPPYPRATLLVDDPPAIELREGLFRIQFESGEYALPLLVMRPSTFIRMTAEVVAAARLHNGERRK